MPPKSVNKTSISSSAAAKLASIPNRSKDNLSPAAGSLTASVPSGSGGRPNKGAYNQEQDELKKEIDQLQNRLAELRSQIGDPKDGSRKPLADRRKALREELDALREEQSRGKASRGKILDQIRVGNESVQRKIKELNTTRGKLPYKCTAEVDTKIRQLESQIESGTMRIVEEKKALNEVQNLRKVRKLVDAFGPQQELIEAEKEKIETLRKQLDGPDSKSANDKWAAIKSELDKINDQLSESSKNRDKLFEERNQLQDKLTELFSKKRESALQYKEANDKYYTKMQEDQKRRIDRQKAERDALEVIKLKEIHAEMREQAAAPAYEREIEDCRTLILYFDKLLGNVPSVEDNESVNSLGRSASGTALPQLKDLRQVTADIGFEGMVIKKKAAEEEFFVGGGAGKKGKKNKKGSTTEGAQMNANQTLHLPLSTMNALHALAVAVPMTREDVVATIGALSVKKQWFVDNQPRVTMERIADIEAKIAADEGKLKALDSSSTIGKADGQGANETESLQAADIRP